MTVDHFRHTRSGAIKKARRGTSRHHVFSRSPRYQLVSSEAAPDADDAPVEAVAYDELTVAELREIAGARGLALPSRATKAELVAALREQDKE